MKAFLILDGPNGFKRPLGAETRIGRDPNRSDVVIADQDVSQVHASISAEGGDGGFRIADLGSTNGTFVCRSAGEFRRVYPSMTLRDGDELRLGETRLRFVVEGPLASIAELEDEFASTRPARSQTSEKSSSGQLIGTTPAMLEVFNLVEKAAGCDMAVLICGETGTGKELVARAIHASWSDPNSPRRRERPGKGSPPMVSLNCAALTESLAESELFGHSRGAFTGAVSERKGYFEAAHQGTLFLDEVGDLPLSVQAKLLRALQEAEIVRVGDTMPREVNVRVISATHRDLNAEVQNERFREDLYYRLAQFEIRVPPLRERLDDVRLIAERLLRIFAEKHQSKQVRGFRDEVIDKIFRNYDWPGNVRELGIEVERAFVMARSGQAIGIGDLSAKLQAVGQLPSSGTRGPLELAEYIKEGQRVGIRAALKRHRGVIQAAAQDLKMTRSGLSKMIKKDEVLRLWFRELKESLGKSPT